MAEIEAPIKDGRKIRPNEISVSHNRLIGFPLSSRNRQLAILKGKKDPLSRTNPKEGGSDAVAWRAVYGRQTENQIRNTGIIHQLNDIH